MWAFVVGGSKGWRVPPPSSPFEPMANWMHRNLNVNHYSLYIYSSASTTFNPYFAAVASRCADRCVSLS